MRCEHDTVTADLPGIEPLPIKPPRITQATRREQMRYEGLKTRPRCESCLYCCIKIVRPDQFDEGEQLRCDVGDFPVQRGGLCNEWAAG